MSVREAMVDDLPEILRMGRLFAEGCGIDVEFDEISAEATALALMEDDNGCLYIDRGGMLGGIVYPHYFNHGKTIAQELFWWCDPEARGTGVGRELFQAFEAWAQVRGATHISMIALASQKPVGRLYERRGYRAMESTYVRMI